MIAFHQQFQSQKKKRYLCNSPGRKTITMNQEKRKGSQNPSRLCVTTTMKSPVGFTFSVLSFQYNTMSTTILHQISIYFELKQSRSVFLLFTCTVQIYTRQYISTFTYITGMKYITVPDAAFTAKNNMHLWVTQLLTHCTLTHNFYPVSEIGPAFK